MALGHCNQRKAVICAVSVGCRAQDSITGMLHAPQTAREERLRWTHRRAIARSTHRRLTCNLRENSKNSDTYNCFSLVCVLVCLVQWWT